jgi:hypothetical protein
MNDDDDDGMNDDDDDGMNDDDDDGMNDDDDDGMNDDDDDGMNDDDDDDDSPAFTIVNVTATSTSFDDSGRTRVTISFVNNGRTSRGTLLLLDLNNDGYDDDDDDGCRVVNGVVQRDDDDDDGWVGLGEVNFQEGVGFVRDICGDNIVIGLGQWNVVPRGATITVEIVFIQRTVMTQNVQINIALRHTRSRGNIPLTPVILVPRQ